MGLLIAVTIAFLVLIVFDAIAFRFGADSRPRVNDDLIPGIVPNAR